MNELLYKVALQKVESMGQQIRAALDTIHSLEAKVISITELHTQQLASLRRENDTMRSIIAFSDLPCMYCGLAKAEMGRCQSGFPGCARADDIMNAPIGTPGSPESGLIGEA